MPGDFRFEYARSTERRARGPYRVAPPREAVARPSAGTVHAAAALLAFVVSGCSLLVDVDRSQCANSKDCARRGLGGECRRGVCVQPSCDGGPCASEFAGSCLDERECESAEQCFKGQCVAAKDVAGFVCAPPLPAARDPLPLHLQLREFSSEKPPKSATLTACRSGDSSCSNPVAMRSDASGKSALQIDLPYGFVGFVEVQSENSLTTLYYVMQPYSIERSQPLLLLTAQARDVLAIAGGYPADASRGLVLMEAYDCSGKSVGGIRFEASNTDCVRFALMDMVPNFDTPVTIRDEAHNRALGGFLNAATGPSTFSARVGVGGPLLGQFSVNVRADAVTYLQWFP